MKRLFVTMLTVLTCGSAYALPVGNPSEPNLMTDGVFWEGCSADICDPCACWRNILSYRFGFYGDYVFNRYMEKRQEDDDSCDSCGDEVDFDVEHTEIYTNAAYFALNAWNRMDFFFALGVTNFIIDDNAGHWGIPCSNHPRFKLESEPQFSWSVGGRIVLYEYCPATLGLEMQYFRTNPDIERITIAGPYSVYPDDFASFRYREWQVGVGVSYRINMFVPYVAVSWAQSQMDFNPDTIDVSEDITELHDLDNENEWGCAVGVSLIDCEKASLTVEADFISEKSIYVNGQFRF